MRTLKRGGVKGDARPVLAPSDSGPSSGSTRAAASPSRPSSRACRFWWSVPGARPRRARQLPEPCLGGARGRDPGASRHAPPFGFGLPRPGKTPYVFDLATFVVARCEIALHHRAGKPLPEGWAIDAKGHPATDPVAALSGAMLPFGGHKGSAIGTMIGRLAGVMIGDLTSPEVLDIFGTTTMAPMHGELILAVSPKAFAAGRGSDPFARARALAEVGTLRDAEAAQPDRFLALGQDAVDRPARPAPRGRVRPCRSAPRRAACSMRHTRS